ncbi:MAG: hypothetical protein K5850_06690 [Bacteroidales bacterium]|nr:hypothetical protein [Bacteroidales bacterium]
MLFAACTKDYDLLLSQSENQSSISVHSAEWLDVKVTERHPQLFAKVKFISGDAATKSGYSSEYYGTGTASIRDLLDMSGEKTSVIKGYSITEIPFTCNRLHNLALLAAQTGSGKPTISPSEVKLFLVNWKDLVSGTEEVYVVTMVPDEEFNADAYPDYSFLNDMDDFSGAILFSDLDGTHVDTYLSTTLDLGHAILLDESYSDVIPDDCITYELSLEQPGTRSLLDKFFQKLGLVAMLDAGGGGSGSAWYDELPASYCTASNTSNTTNGIYSSSITTAGLGWTDPGSSKRDGVLNAVKEDVGGGNGNDGNKVISKALTIGKKQIKVSGKKNDVDSFVSKTKEAFKLKVIKNLIGAISNEVTIEIKEVVKTDDGVKTLALTHTSGLIEITIDADSGIVFEELLHVYQGQAEGSNWTTGDKEFEAKVFDSILYFEHDLEYNYIHEKATHTPFYEFYQNPSEDNYTKALQAMRNDPIAYNERKFPITDSFSPGERIKHIKEFE